jgi:hypothetical protein
VIPRAHHFVARCNFLEKTPSDRDWIARVKDSDAEASAKRWPQGRKFSRTVRCYGIASNIAILK